MPARPTLHVIAGVNGAGKTRFYRHLLAPLTPGAEFVNADEIARERWPGREAEHTVEAARLAAERRQDLLDARLTFVTETVFSHESKLELVRDALARGYSVILYHVHVSSADLARARIATRVAMGEHDVPSERVAARYERCLRLIPQAAALADRAFVLDNSGTGAQRTHTHVMTLERGRITRLQPDPPQWLEDAYREALAAHRRSNR